MRKLNTRTGVIEHVDLLVNGLINSMKAGNGTPEQWEGFAIRHDHNKQDRANSIRQAMAFVYGDEE